MAALSPELRSVLEAGVVAGRRAAEAAARAALGGLGVFDERRPEHLEEGRARLRVGLRAKWRQLGGDRELLVAECAYEQWHRLLFARFLAENNLLLHPDFGAPVTLEECEDLAAELDEPDGWSVAGRFAAEILPGIFRLDDPCVQLRLAPEGRDALEQILAGLPSEVFRADDALGWVYQYWQKEKKDEVNRSERKIGGADLGPVTQLFTEHYMVRFLLENSLGAWWAGRHPDSPLVETFDYLRMDDDGAPAAGRFDGWPEHVAEVTVMDPCCGSGHFLVEAFSMLWQMRVEEEGLSPVDAQDAVLRDNLFGLEIDPRCVQIAMFALALQAWKAGGGWRQLPAPNIACSGISIKATLEDWTALGRGDIALEDALTRLHSLFREADSLGSLLNPRRELREGGLLTADLEQVLPVISAALASERGDAALAAMEGTADALRNVAKNLLNHYTLVVTNPPFLNMARSSEFVRQYVKRVYPEGRSELATAFSQRISELMTAGGSVALVLPQNYLFLGSYRRLREDDLEAQTWNIIARLGPGAFRGITGEVVNVVLLVRSRSRPKSEHAIAAIDISSDRGVDAKAAALADAPAVSLRQKDQRANPEARFIFGSSEDLPMLSDHVMTSAGIQTGDYPRFGRYFWEVAKRPATWSYQQSTPRSTTPYGGRESVLRWEDGQGDLAAFVAEKLADLSPSAWLRGTHFRGRRGVAVKLMGELPATLFEGTLFDNNVGVLVPKTVTDLPALWAFCSSAEFAQLVRLFNPSMKAEPSAIAKVPFDVDRWRAIAAERYPDGLPEPWSDDPTQWLFEGRPEASMAPLQGAVARLLGYQWPEQSESDDLDAFADADGIVCLPSVAQEPSAADRLEEVLRAAYGNQWSPNLPGELLEQAGSKKKLADWLRDEFFKQHCALFGHRPFVWHIWDGLRDGFSALVNYHRFDRHGLEKLTYTYLGQDWVERQRAAARDEEPGADQRLAAALELQRKLEAILEGQPPLDIYVRWKPLHEQPMGWEPDLNDGVRLNVRPFVEAGVLRSKVNVHWRKDRGKNIDGSERHNDLHYPVAEKQAARAERTG